MVLSAAARRGCYPKPTGIVSLRTHRQHVIPSPPARNLVTRDYPQPTTRFLPQRAVRRTDTCPVSLYRGLRDRQRFDAGDGVVGPSDQRVGIFSVDLALRLKGDHFAPELRQRLDGVRVLALRQLG
jgi:hypothetical protein